MEWNLSERRGTENQRIFMSFLCNLTEKNVSVKQKTWHNSVFSIL